MKIFGKHIHIGLIQLGAYVAVVLVAAIAFQGFQTTQDQLCTSAQKDQIAMRTLVMAVVSLENELIQDHNVDHPERTKHKLAEVEKFKKAALEAFDTPVCEEN